MIICRGLCLLLGSVFLTTWGYAQDLSPKQEGETPAVSPTLPPDVAWPPLSKPMAMPGRGGGGGPMGGGPPGYDATWYPTQTVRGQSADLGLVRQGLSLGAPIWRNGGDMLLANFSVRNTLFFTDAILPDSRHIFPDQLWNLNLGFNYMHQFENGWSGMLMTGFGSASDKPFNSLREVTATLGGFLKIPAANERDTWQFGALYMAGGQLNFPIPIISYGWNPSKSFQMNIGLPLTVHWKPMEDWALDLSYTPVLNINAKLAYHFAPTLKIYCGYEYLTESYFLADRETRDERFFSIEQRLISGIKHDIGESGLLDVNAGYSFGRRYGSGDTQFSNLKDRIDVAPGAFLGLRLSVRF
jgi:hypothetical protein